MTLRAEHLYKKYKSRTVVNDISVHVEQGEIVGLLGPNGAGKTTTFYMIVGLIKPNEGKIFLENDDVTELPMYQRAKRGIGYLAQEASVFRKLTVEENILDPYSTDAFTTATLSITDRAYLLVDGKLFKAGSAEDLANDPLVRKVYLGQNFKLRRANIPAT